MNWGVPNHHTMALATLAILGHRLAHSFPIGPVIAEPAAAQQIKHKLDNYLTIHLMDLAIWLQKCLQIEKDYLGIWYNLKNQIKFPMPSR